MNKTSEVRVTDPITGGQKGSKDERYDLVPVYPQEELARVYNFGAKKYAPNNYLLGYAWSLGIAALLRHVVEFRKGNRKDPESGLDHLAHAAFHVNALMMFDEHGLGTDDRWKPATMPAAAHTGNVWLLRVGARVRIVNPEDGFERMKDTLGTVTGHDREECRPWLVKLDGEDAKTRASEFCFQRNELEAIG